MPTPDLRHLVQPSGQIAVRVTPRAARNLVRIDEVGMIRVQVTCAPEDGKANRAVTRLLADALGVAPGRLELLRGAKHRDKLFRLL
ncbi:DUF167 domain-containing protein [Plastorhodobacter daqingensis]|uniref:UPF0235 protein ACFQXB_02890 n=1 Tax=Plastorhodobacter daqingensis TaxID=1387281 RepID=A0ABW2UGN0_9RHOB